MDEKKEPTLLQQRKKDLFFAPTNGYDRLAPGEEEDIQAYCAGYKTFLDEGKTERECVDYAIGLAEAAGFRPLVRGEKLRPGDKVYRNNRGKSLLLAVIGQESLNQGAVIGAAHIDSPRLDLKQNPLYEEKEMAYCKTHYYGGIKKYQWTTIPLALHGVVVRRDGTVVPVRIGEAPGDPQFTVGDLLPHLAGDQAKKTMGSIVSAEQLNLFVGSRPFGTEEGSDRVKLAMLEILQEKYGMVEEDFLSAELEVVPAGRARDLGFDRSMVLGYGQDDSVCAYTSLVAQLDVAGEELDRAAVCVLVDKEEIGSVGATGMASQFFENTIAEIMELAGEGGILPLRRALAASAMLSSDVSAGFDPAYASVFEAKNSAYLGHGLVFNKYTGARGKSGSNDARAEYMARIRKIMDDAGVQFQTCELGKVDAGGGGTIAYIPAKYGMDVIDSGVAVLSMHSPWEATSKADIYEAERGYEAFLRA